MSKQCTFDYKIPVNILSKIPKEFWLLMFQNLKSTFSKEITDFNLSHLPHITSTSGWSDALYHTCHSIDMIWFYDYWDSLNWWQSDLVDDYLAVEIANKIRQGG